MKKLIITAHPSIKWFTHKLALNYKKWAKESWHEAEIINLYDEKYHQDFLKFEDIQDIKENKVRNIFHKKINEAEEIVFIFPIWWGNVPAILKNFFDMNLSSGFAFKFLSWWKVEKLLTWKKSKIIATCDAPWFMYKFFIFPNRLKGYFKMYLLWFCWIKVTDFLLFDFMNKNRSDLDRKKMLDKVYNLAWK